MSPTSIMDEAHGESWSLYNGDSAEVLPELPDRSVDFSIFSPPFSSTYTYSPSDRDLGNVRDDRQFWEQFSFVSGELLRLMKPGRLVAVHVANLPMYEIRDGASGRKDFRGDTIRHFERAGFVYHSEIGIQKQAQAAAIRTHSKGLLFVQLQRDAAAMWQAWGDYVLVFRAPGKNPEPITTELTQEDWIEFAHPFWLETGGLADEKINVPRGDLRRLWEEIRRTDLTFDEWWAANSDVWTTVRETDVLSVHEARANDDERHLCLAAGSLVLTRDGYIPIERVAVGMEVLTHEGRWRPVLARRSNGIKPVIRTCAQGVADLRTTADHKLWARVGRGRRAKEQALRSEPEWIPAGNVLGSYLNLKLPPIEENALTEAECWAIGRWLGDGHRAAPRHGGARGGSGQFLISCSHTEAPGLITKLGRLAGHVFTNVTATQIALGDLSPGMRATLARCGRGAAGKLVPGELLTLDRPHAEALLSGYLSADGHYVAKHDRWMASSVSRSLLLGMALVAQRARGVVASVYTGRPPRKCEIQGRVVETQQDWIYAFRNEHGYRQGGWIGNDGAWKKVRRSEAAGYAEVWDLRVADDASFTAEGAVVKNCPLQISVIERAVRLWSGRGETVLSPFAGIGSEGVGALRHDRRFVGVELKPAYFTVAARNLRNAEGEKRAGTLFDALDAVG